MGDPNRLFLICFDSLLFFSDKSASIKQLMLAFALWRREKETQICRNDIWGAICICKICKSIANQMNFDLKRAWFMLFGDQ